MQRGLSFLLLLMMSGVAAWFGIHSSYQRQFTPASLAKESVGIFRDGWVVDGATLSLPGLASRGNQLHLRFNPWRPDGVAPARIKISVCDEVVSDITIESDEPHVVFLTGSCLPRTVSFDVVNPFVASPTDQRELGAQIFEGKVTSRLGVIIPSPFILAKVTLIVMGLSLLAWLVFSCSSLTFVTYLIPLMSYILISNALYFRLDKLDPVALLAAFLLIGMYLAKRWRGDAKLQAPRLFFQSPEPQKTAAPVLVLVAAITGGAAWLRFSDLDFGLPANFHPDEVPKVNAIMRMRTNGNFDPDYFLHPTLLLYSTYGMNTLLRAVGLLEGTFQETAFLAGRVVSALAGTLSVWITYVIGKRLFDQKVGILSALFLAVFPLHVTSSRYLKEDALLTFFVLLCLWTVLKAVQENKPKLLLLAAAFAGLSSSVKYSGFLTCLLVAAAPWLRSRALIPDKHFFLWGVASALVAPLAFLAASPYVILNSDRFAIDFAFERKHMKKGHTVAITPWSQFWMYHFERSITPGMSLIGTLVACAGAGVLLWKRRLEGWFLVACILLFYLPAEYVRAKPAPQPERYIFPCMPFLAITAASLIGFLVDNKRFAAASVLALAVFVTPLYRSIGLTSEIGDDTREQMARWIQENIEPGAKIYIDHKRYSPELSYERFNVEHAPRAVIHRDLDPQILSEMGVQYLILSSLWYDRYFSQPRADEAVRRRLERLFNVLPVVKEFEASFGTYGFHNPTLTLFSLDPDARAALEQERTEKGEPLSNHQKSSFHARYKLIE